MVNYANGKIYKIVSDQTEKCYVGSTTKKYLSDRMSNHRNDRKRYQLGKQHYVTSYEILKYDDCKIILLENYPCQSKDQLHARERHYIENLNCVNKVIPTRKMKEYYQDNKESIAKQMKEYREINKESIAKHKKKYRQTNKEEIQAHRSKVESCECGMTYTHAHKLRHEKTAKHKQFFSHINIIRRGLEIIKDLDKYYPSK